MLWNFATCESGQHATGRFLVHRQPFISGTGFLGPFGFDDVIYDLIGH